MLLAHHFSRKSSPPPTRYRGATVALPTSPGASRTVQHPCAVKLRIGFSNNHYGRQPEAGVEISSFREPTGACLARFPPTGRLLGGSGNPNSSLTSPSPRRILTVVPLIGY